MTCLADSSTRVIVTSQNCFCELDHHLHENRRSPTSPTLHELVPCTLIDLGRGSKAYPDRFEHKARGSWLAALIQPGKSCNSVQTTQAFAQLQTSLEHDECKILAGVGCAASRRCKSTSHVFVCFCFSGSFWTESSARLHFQEGSRHPTFRKTILAVSGHEAN